MSLRQSGTEKVAAFVDAVKGLITAHNSSSSAHSTEMAKKVNVAQGSGNSGKFLKVNSSGNVACESVTIPSAYTHPSQSLGTLPSSVSLKKIKYDANGHITATADVAASDLPSHTHDQYLTSHQDISDLATKSQIEEVSAKADNKQNELIAGSNITLTATSELPSGYTQLDYIVGNKSQYIDTGWKFTNTYPVKIDCKFMPYEAEGVSGYGIPYGLQTTSYTNWIYPFYMGNGFLLHLGGSAGIDSIPIVFNSIYDTSFTINNGTWSRTINGETTTGSYSGSIDTTSNMYLMGGSHGSQPINQMNGRIYSFKITVNNNVILNYIPARRNSDNAIGMYDTVSSTFKASTGGGNFVGGNAISKTTISSSVGNHNQDLSTINNVSTVAVVVTYTDNTSETLNLVKYTGS